MVRSGVLAGILLIGTTLQAQEKAPVPSAEVQKESETLIRSIFKEDYAKRTPESQAALARKLLDQGRDPKADPVSRYVLFREATDLAIKGDDPARALEAVQAVADSFQVDELALKVQVLTDSASGARLPEQARRFAEASLGVIEKLVASDRLDEAKGIGVKAEAIARITKDLGLVSRVQKQKREVESLYAEYQKTKSAEATLQATPEDPAANLALGRYLAGKGALVKAIPYLAKGSDPALKGAAESDVAAPSGSAAQAQVANGWWEVAEREKEGSLRKAFQERARNWYDEALVGATGLPRVVIEKRLDMLDRAGMSGPPAPPKLRILTYAEFDREAGRFPAAQDLAPRGAKVAASSCYATRVPENVLKGQRRSDAWTLAEASGWFEATWDPPVRGKTLVLMGRNSPAGSDGWGASATITLNGTVKLPVGTMGGSRVIIVDLGSAGRLQSVRAEISGSSLPGLSTLEVYR